MPCGLLYLKPGVLGGVRQQCILVHLHPGAGCGASGSVVLLPPDHGVWGEAVRCGIPSPRSRRWGVRQCVVLLIQHRPGRVRCGIVALDHLYHLYHHGPGCGGCGSSALWSTAAPVDAALLLASSSCCMRATSRRAASSLALSRCCFIIPGYDIIWCQKRKETWRQTE